MGYTLAVVLILTGLVAVGQALTCCTTSTASTDSNPQPCASTINITIVGAACLACTKSRSEANGVWADSRSCDSTTSTATCTSASLFGVSVTSCSCDTDMCNSADALLFSTFTMIAAVLGKTVL